MMRKNQVLTREAFIKNRFSVRRDKGHPNVDRNPSSSVKKMYTQCDDSLEAEYHSPKINV